MPGFYYPNRNYHPTTPGDAGAVRGYASKLRRAASTLQSISDDADSQVNIYTSGQGAWVDQFVTMWDESITGNNQRNSHAWALDRANFIKANPRMARLYDANSTQSRGAFTSLVEACNQMADALDQYAHAIDQEIAQEWDIFLDIVIIAASIVVTALSFGALGPEAMMVDIFFVGATIGGVTSAAIDFSNQMVNNIVVNHDGFGAALGNINMQELASAYITGYIVGGVSSVVGMGLPKLLSAAGGFWKAAATNTISKIGIEAVGFGAGTFAGDIAAQEVLSLDMHLRLTPVDWGTAGKDALVATAGGVVLGGLMHGLGIGGRAPDVAGAADPTSQQWAVTVSTVDESGGRISYFALSDPKGGPDLTLYEGSPFSRSGVTEIGPGRLVDGATLVTNDGNLQIDLTRPGNDMVIQAPGRSSWINVGPDGQGRFVAETAISDGSIKLNVVPGDRPFPSDLSVDPNTGEMQVPKDWKVVADYNGGKVTVTAPWSDEASYTFSMREPGTQGWGGVDPKMIAGPATGGGDTTGGGIRPNVVGDSPPELAVQTIDRPVVDGGVVDGPAVDPHTGPPIDPTTATGGLTPDAAVRPNAGTESSPELLAQTGGTSPTGVDTPAGGQQGGGLRLEPAAPPTTTETPETPGTPGGQPGVHNGDAGQPEQPAGQGGAGVQPVARQDEIVQALRQIEGLKPNVWNTLDAGQRISTLQGVEDAVAGVQGRSPMRVTMDQLPSNLVGQYDPATGTIRMNVDALDGSVDQQRMLEAVLHEGRHAYQAWAIDNPGFHPDAGQVTGWDDNWRAYVQPSPTDQAQFARYWEQPLEGDARSYEPIARMILDGLGDPVQTPPLGDLSDVPTQPLPRISEPSAQPLPDQVSGERRPLADAVPPDQVSGDDASLPRGLDKAWDGTWRVDGPLLRIPARPAVDATGVPAHGLEGASGPVDTDLGMPTDFTQGAGASVGNHDPGLVDLVRTDAVERTGVARLDLTRPLEEQFPNGVPEEFRNRDFVVINNPRGFEMNFELGRDLVRPGGRIVIQGRAEVVDGMRANPDMNRLLGDVRAGRAPDGFRVVEVLTDPTIRGPLSDPTQSPKPSWLLGGDGGFHRTDGGDVGWPNTRIVYERMIDPADTSQPRVVPETHWGQRLDLVSPDAGPRPENVPPAVDRPPLASADPPDQVGGDPARELPGGQQERGLRLEPAASAKPADTPAPVPAGAHPAATGDAAALANARSALLHVLQQHGLDLTDPRVSAFRAQGRPLLEVDSEGNVTVNELRGRQREGVSIHIGFDVARARFWLTDMGRDTVVEFQVRQSFLDRLRAAAEPENIPNRSRSVPWRVDLHTRGQVWADQYAIPPAWFDDLRASIVPGSGRVWRLSDLLPVGGPLQPDTPPPASSPPDAAGSGSERPPLASAIPPDPSSGDPAASAVDAAEAEREAAAVRAVADASGWIKRYGAAGEAAELQGLAQRGAVAADLNVLPSVGAAKNFPLLDSISSEGLSSVKVKMGSTFDPVVPPSRLRAYSRDFAKLLDDGRATAAAQALLDPRNQTAIQDLQALGAWPSGLSANPTTTEVATFIQEHARLSIPEDHVPQVQGFLRDDIPKFPTNYGFPDGVAPTAAQVDALVDRVQSNGISSAAIDAMVNRAQAVPLPGPPSGRPAPASALPPGFDPSVVEPTGALMPAAAVVRAQLSGPAVAVSRGVLDRVNEVDAALRALGNEPGARQTAERALNALQRSIDEGGRALTLYDVAQVRLRNEVDLARSLPPDQRPPQLAEAESLARNDARDAMAATLDGARGVLQAGHMRLAVEPAAPLPLHPPTPAEAREVRTQAAVDALRTEQVVERERLWHEQQLQVANAEPGERPLVRQRYAEARLLLAQQQELATVGLRVLAYITEWDPYKGGVPAVNRNLCLGLAEAGHDVFVRVGHEVPRGHVDGGVHLIGPSEYVPGLDSRYQLQYRGEELPQAVDLVIGHSRFSGPAALQIHDERFPEARFVHVVHMVTDALARVQEKPVAEGLRNQAIERDLVAQSDLAVGVGPVLRAEVERLAAMTGSTPAIHELIPGVPFEQPVPPPRGEHRSTILLFGRVDDSQKGTAAAALMVRDLPPDVTLIVRGAPPETVAEAQEELSQIAGRFVEVRPRTIDRAELLVDMRQADVVIMPSRAEGFGLVGLEAAGAGVPILVPSSSGVGRFIGDSGLFPTELARQALVEQGFEEPVPVERWVARLREVLSDPEAARHRALDLRLALQEQNRTWRGAAESLVAAVRAAVDRPSPAVQPPAAQPQDDEEPRSGAGGGRNSR